MPEKHRENQQEQDSFSFQHQENNSSELTGDLDANLEQLEQHSEITTSTTKNTLPIRAGNNSFNLEEESDEEGTTSQNNEVESFELESTTENLKETGGDGDGGASGSGVANTGGGGFPPLDPNQNRENTTGLPNDLKQEVELKSGFSLDDVKVHYNSYKPFELNANAFAQGNEIYLAPGQEEHLPEELWHVVQQKQGRVSATNKLDGTAVNQNTALEEEAKANLNSGKNETNSLQSSSAETNLSIVQMNDDKMLNFQIPIDGQVTGKQLKEYFESQIYGEIIGSNWLSNGVPIPDDKLFGTDGKTTTYSVNVPAGKYRHYRAKTEKGAGVEITEENTVVDAEKRAKELAGLPKATQDLLKEEINRRFREATGKSTKGPDDDELWNVFRDEVLAQRDKIMNPSPKVQLLVKKTEEGGITITPKDYPKMIQIIEKIESLDIQVVEEYASRVAGKAGSIEEMKTSLDRFLKVQEERAKNKEERIAVENELFGTEEVFDDMQTFETVAIAGGGLAASQLYTKLGEKAKEYGFSSVTEYENKVKEYLASFQQEAVQTGIAVLQKYEHFLYEEEQRYLSTADADKLGQQVAKTGADKKYKEADQNKSYASMADMAMGTSGNRSSQAIEDNIEGYRQKARQLQQEADQSMSAFGGDHPLLKDKAFDLRKLSEQAPDDTKAFLLNYIAKQRKKIADTKAKMQSDEDFVFKLDNLVQHMYQQEGISKGSIQDKAIQDRISSIKLKDALISIGIALLAIGLGLLSGGGGTVGVMAAVGGAALSVYDVTREFGKYAEEKDAHDVGLLAKDPSFGWVILAMVGAGLDFAAVAKLLKPLKPSVEAFEATVKADPAKALTELEAKLAKIDGIDAKLQANILQRAKSEAAIKEIISSGNPLTILTPQKLVPLAREAAKMGITKVEDFFALLKQRGLQKSIGDLTPEEIKTLRESLEIAVEVKTKFPKIKTLLQERIGNSHGFILKHSDDDIKTIIEKGKRLKLSDTEINDMLFISCREAKQLDAKELMQQMDNWVNVVQKRGYPYKFTSLQEYEKFSSELKDGLKQLGIDASDVRVQGSSLRTPNANDIDLVAMVKQEDFDKFVISKYKKSIKKENVVIDISNYSTQDLIDLAEDIANNKALYNSKAYGDFRYTIQQGIINAKGSKKIIKGFKDLRDKLADSYPHLNIENIAIQPVGSGFDLEPFLKL